MAPESSVGSPADDPLQIDLPDDGRIHSHRRRVHLADTSPKGRVRLDALARMLQDVSDEDTTDAGFPPDEPWVVRRVDMGIESFPAFRDMVTVSTWCSGIGGRWAERRVRIEGDAGGRVEAAVLWVHLDASGRPARLPERFDSLYAPAARGRKVRARLHHAPAPEGASPTPFPLRKSDFDLMGHVNNAVSWIPVDDALGDDGALTPPIRVTLEHPGPIDRGDVPGVVVDAGVDGFDLWIIVDGAARSSAQVRRWGGRDQP
ncbi:MAG: thioesterase [Acidimicrobiales bacterium]|nr:thioesterase [Acidimicrobiales bacterium]